MTECRISAASNEGAHVLRLEGDVRLVMCTALDEYFEQMFNDPNFVSVWVDVTEASGLDSTTLGMLAKLAITTHERYDFKPAIFSCNDGINRLLSTMGFAQLFELRTESCGADEEAYEIPMRAATEEEVRQKVIEAHRTLMALNEDNRSAFEGLVQTLEAR